MLAAARRPDNRGGREMARKSRGKPRSGVRIPAAGTRHFELNITRIMGRGGGRGGSVGGDSASQPFLFANRHPERASLGEISGREYACPRPEIPRGSAASG